MKKPLLKEKIKEVWFAPYEYLITVIITNNVLDSRTNRNEKLGELDKEFFTKYTDALHNHNNSPEGHIFLNENVTFGTIAHECYHAISRMFQWIGAEKEEEITAYHIGYLVDEIEKFKKDKL